MDKWAEIRTAFKVAELGTISGAAKALGLHRATVVRHIETLEQELGEKIFQRHSRGYVPTDVGKDLVQVGRSAEEQFNQLLGRTRNKTAALSGQFIVTSLEYVAQFVLPALAQFQDENPKMSVSFKASSEILKLEYGAAHVAVRAGSQPAEQDNVVRPFMDLKFGLYAHRKYIARYGLPDGPGDHGAHKFVRWDTRGFALPFTNWFETDVPETSIVMSSADPRIAEQGVLLGMGIGLFLESNASAHHDLIQVAPSKPGWKATLWTVTHVDLHRTAKVRAFLKILRQTGIPA